MNLREMQNRVSDQLMSTRMVQSLLHGQLEREQYVAYLSDVYSYAQHSSQVIGIAGVRLVLSHPPLAEYLFRHAEEELGHDRWAASDLRDLGLSEEKIAAIQPSSACLRMIGLEYLYAHHWNPIGLFGWMFVLESLGGRVAGGLAARLDEVLKLNGRALYFLKGHGEADAHHSEDLYRIVADNVRDADDLNAFQTMADEASAIYCEILDRAFERSRLAAA